MKQISLCSIANVSSGNCSEDCAYCTQSAHNHTNIEKYKFRSTQDVVNQAKIMRSYGAVGFCLVTAGLGLDSKKCEYVAKLAFEISRLDLGLNLIACNGEADVESLEYLRKNGIKSYNHNLETAQSHFPKICSTHTWESRYQTCQNAIEAGLNVVSGGIFGIGENEEQRHEHLKALATLNPKTSPINFFIPNPNLPIKQAIIGKKEALSLIALARSYLPNARLMIAGGREIVFGDDQEELFKSEINAVVLGDYLTTKGNNPADEINKIKSYGCEIATVCHG